jgi:hypothetical protein
MRWWRSATAACMTGMVVWLLGAGGCRDAQTDLSVRPGPAPRTFEELLADANLQVYWTRPILEGGRERVERIDLIGENLYFLTNLNCLRAVDAAVGNPRWMAIVGRPRDKVFSPTHFDGLRLTENVGTVENIKTPPPSEEYKTFNAVLVNSTTHLFVVDRASGKVYREHPFSSFLATNTGVTDGMHFYAAGSDRQVYAVNLQTMVNSWGEWIGEMVLSPMAYFGGWLYLGTTDGMMRCADVGDYGKKQWQVKYDGSIGRTVHADARGLFFACEDRRIYGLNTETGGTLWDPVVVQGVPDGPMQVGELTLFQYVRDEGLCAVNLANGTVRWKMPQGRMVLALMNGTAYVLDDAQNLRPVNEVTGQGEQVIPLRGFDFFAANLHAPAIYAADRFGKVVCIRLKSAGRLTPEMLR